MTDVAPSAAEPPDARTYFAAERTLLAWIRTGLAMMGFGFVVARFGLFLRELAAMPGAHVGHHSGFSLWIGTVLVLCGVAVNLFASLRHVSTLNRLEQGRPLRFPAWSLGVGIGMLLGVIGLVMAGYLLLGLAY